jgi:hypothetical protein
MNMGLGSALGSIGRALVPRPGMTSYRTPPFLPEDEPLYEDREATYGAPDESESDAPPTAKPPVSAASAIGGKGEYQPKTFRPEMSPEQQKAQEIANQGAPLHPKHSKLRSIGEALTSGFLGPEMSETLWDSGYSRQRKEYEHSLGNAARAAEMRQKAEKGAADVSHTMTTSGAQAKDTQNADAALLLKGVDSGAVVDGPPITVGGRTLTFPKGMPLAERIQEYVKAGYSEEQAKILAVGGKPSDFEKPQSVRNLEELAARTVADSKLTPEQKKVKLEEIKNAHNVLNPERPVIQWTTDKTGTLRAVTTTPSEVVKAGGTQSFGQIGKPQQPPASGAPGSASDDPKLIAQGIMAGRQPPTMTALYRNGGPVRAELERNKYDLATATMDWDAIKRHLSTLNGPQQERLRQAVNFTYDSLDQIEQLYGEWKREAGVSGLKVINKANLAVSKELGGKAGAAAQVLEAQINDLTSELGTVYKGGNASTDESLRLAAENLKADWNEQTFKKAIDQVRKNLQIRRNSINTSVAVGVSPNSPYARGGGGQPDASGGTAIPTVTTKAEYDALPAGAVYVEDGKKYRKP